MKKPVKIFGILNVTPDSFSDGGAFLVTEKALAQAEKLFTDGADYVDVGGQSTRPGAVEISWESEWERVRGVIEALLEKYPDQISLDTKHWQTAENFLSLGGTVLNDVSGFQDPRMIEVAAEFQPMCIVNHFPGKTADLVHEQKISSINQVREELLSRKADLLRSGVSAEKIILDPGIGFGKTMELNWELLEFSALVPEEKVLIGHSKKRFLGEHRFEMKPNLEAAKIAVEAGAWGMRVHEVVEHRELQITNYE